MTRRPAGYTTPATTQTSFSSLPTCIFLGLKSKYSRRWAFDVSRHTASGEEIRDSQCVSSFLTRREISLDAAAQFRTTRCRNGMQHASITAQILMCSFKMPRWTLVDGREDAAGEVKKKLPTFIEQAGTSEQPREGHQLHSPDSDYNPHFRCWCNHTLLSVDAWRPVRLDAL